MENRWVIEPVTTQPQNINVRPSKYVEADIVPDAAHHAAQFVLAVCVRIILSTTSKRDEPAAFELQICQPASWRIGIICASASYRIPTLTL